MENSILYGVGKKVRNGYLNGQIPENFIRCRQEGKKRLS